jgi:hypothetical protein
VARHGDDAPASSRSGAALFRTTVPTEKTAAWNSALRAFPGFDFGAILDGARARGPAGSGRRNGGRAARQVET